MASLVFAQVLLASRRITEAKALLDEADELAQRTANEQLAFQIAGIRIIHRLDPEAPLERAKAQAVAWAAEQTQSSSYLSGSQLGIQYRVAARVLMSDPGHRAD